uniref:Uncharacterized protein n=1 Tax=Panagrolaimus sp. JU765 TaxID=591449 RepID=A0AC34Q2C1_9BILA
MKNAKDEPLALIPTSSLVQVSVSRAAVDYMLDELDLTTYIQTIERGFYGFDELFMATLNANPELGLPGGFTNDCIKKGVLSRTITRYTAWDADEGHCESNLKRHSMCVFGMEDLLRMRLKYFLFANKMAQDYDFGAVDCMAEKIFNLTYREPYKQYYDYEFYEELPV